MDYKYIHKINSPDDLKRLKDSELSEYINELRHFLIENVERTGGHLASNLGAVELCVALHRVFDSPHDHIIFDVGHQAYVHKIITGRREGFANLRSPGGLSGFTLRRESEHDPFGAGHSSTSISAALGFAEADALAKNKAFTVCVIGDGAYTGGMVHEALNNCKAALPLIIILNENGMSISLNKGTFASYLSRVRVSGNYRNFKRITNGFLLHVPLIGRMLKRLATFIKKNVKTLLYKPNYFEELGMYYIGPIDGNDYGKVAEALSRAKMLGGTTVVHLKTVKGKGYFPAESSPDGYHSVVKAHTGSTFHSAFAEKLIDIASGDEGVVAVTAAMGIGTGLDAFGEKFPDRYFDVGIAEGHALTFSAGLCAAGLSPYVAIYSTFLQRGYDSLLHDVALQNLSVKLLIDRAGLALGDGATHHGIFDVSFISHIPNMTLFAPVSYASLGDMLDFASSHNGPVAIRYPNSKENRELLSAFSPLFDDVCCRILSDFDKTKRPQMLYITYGKIYEKVSCAADALRGEGYEVGVIVLETLKPLDRVAKELLKYVDGRRCVFVEEGIKSGGAAMGLLEELRLAGASPAMDYRIAAIDDSFASPEEPQDIYSYVGLSPEKLVLKMKEVKKFDT